MAEQEILTASENVINPDPSQQQDSQEGKLPSSIDLVQAVVADQGFLSKLWSALMPQMAPKLHSKETAVLQGQADSNISRESEDQRGSSNISLTPEVLNGQTGENEPSNPAVSDDQSNKRVRSQAIIHVVDDDCPVPTKQSRVTVEDSGTYNDLEVFDSDIVSPNSRWEASDNLAQFLGTAVKCLTKFERRSLVKVYPRPDVDVAYTPNMDEYLKLFIQGITAPDKPLKEIQDSVLDVLGPLCTLYENLLSMDSAVATDGVVQLDAPSVHNFSECIKHALLLLGDVAARISRNCRELVLAKINPLMVSLAQEEFSDSKRDLFGSSFEQRLKTRSETAETISKGTRVGKPFFRGGPPGDSTDLVEASKVSASSCFIHPTPVGMCFPHAEYIVAEPEPNTSPHGSQDRRLTDLTSRDTLQPTRLAT